MKTKVTSDAHFPEPPSWPGAPGWIPTLVREQALLFSLEYGQKPKAVSLALRLASDPRMKTVWDELAKRKRSSLREYVYAAREVRLEDDRQALVSMAKFLKFRGAPLGWLAKPNRATADAAQEWAVWQFFRKSFHLAHDQRPALRIASELKKKERAFRRVAPHLRAAAGLLGTFHSEDQQVLERLALSFETASAPEWGLGFVARKKGDSVTRAYVMALAWITEGLFRTSLAGSIATTASVALGGNITGDQVKSILASEIRYPSLFDDLT